MKKQQRSTGVSDQELIKIAVKSLGLNDLYPFKPEEKIIEYMLKEQDEYKRLSDNAEEHSKIYDWKSLMDSFYSSISLLG